MLTSLALIFLVGLAMAALCQQLHLPRIIGMLVTGILLGPCVLNALDASILSISSELRQMALIIILIKAGLSLNLADLKKVGRPAVMMSCVPASCEILAFILFAPAILGITRIEAAVMGAVLGAVSPAVVIPRMNGIGTVGVVIAAPEGEPSQALLQQVQADLDAVREIAVDVTVLAPEIETVPVSAQMLPKTGVRFETAKIAAEKAVKALFTGALLGKNLYRSAISSAIFATGLVENVALLQPQADIPAAAKTLCRLGALTITEADA